MARVLLALVVFLASATCSSGPKTTACPDQFDPAGLSDDEMTKQASGRLPERGATAEDNVVATAAKRRGFLEQNYKNVQEVGAGEGWGVTYTRDEFGTVSYHRDPDHIIVVTLSSRKDCPETLGASLLVLDEKQRRVPVEFVYPSR